MFFLPFSPRCLMMKHREDQCLALLSQLRRLDQSDPLLVAEFLEIKAAVMFDEETEVEMNGAGGWLAPWKALFRPNMFKRLSIGCWIMIFQQFTGISAALMRSRGVSIVASTNWMFNFIIGLTTRNMIKSMKYGTYIFFAFFSGAGGVFVVLVFTETKDKTLEELDIFFGGTENSLAATDREKMRKINERLGIANVNTVEDFRDREPSVSAEKPKATKE
ncbi:hypothetical protein DV736_g1016, partial [Chaetothyriales sp. CBS 134916]